MQYENNPANVFQDIVRKLNYHPPSIKVNNGIKIEGEKLGQSHNPQKAHLHPLRHVSVQYENNPASALRDIDRKRNADARPHSRTPDMVMIISPAPTSWAGDKKRLKAAIKHKL